MKHSNLSVTPVMRALAAATALVVLTAPQAFATPSSANIEDFNQRQAQLDVLKKGTSLSSPSANIYGVAKAQCWVNFAKHEWTRNDRSAVVRESLDEADKLMAQLKQPGSISQETRLVDGAQRMRGDLWQSAANMKTLQGYQCSAAATACAEVLLVQGAHNTQQLGWRYGNPYFGMAEDMLEYARAEELKCRPQPVIAAAPVPVPVQPRPVEPLKPVVIPKVERITIAASALFKFDRYKQTDLLPEGKKEIENAAAKLKSYKNVISIKLVGYTDRLGKDSYNLPLSINRAITVKSYLTTLGIDPNKVDVRGEGADKQVKACDEKADKSLRNKRKLQDCLQPNRRVEFIIIAEDK